MPLFEVYLKNIAPIITLCSKGLPHYDAPPLYTTDVIVEDQEFAESKRAADESQGGYQPPDVGNRRDIDTEAWIREKN